MTDIIPVDIRAEDADDEPHVQLHRRLVELIPDPAEVLEVSVNLALYALQKENDAEVLDSVIEVLRSLRLKNTNVH